MRGRPTGRRTLRVFPGGPGAGGDGLERRLDLLVETVGGVFISCPARDNCGCGELSISLAHKIFAGQKSRGPFLSQTASSSTRPALDAATSPHSELKFRPTTPTPDGARLLKRRPNAKTPRTE